MASDLKHAAQAALTAIEDGESLDYLEKVVANLVAQDLHDALHEPEKKPDPINPAHYRQGGIECIEAIKAATVCKPSFQGYLVGNVLKYLWRYEAKNGIEDVRKAQWYLNKLLIHLDEE